jgi:hypothetical protein
MGDLKPLGSEKLNGDDKLKRILELTYYNQNKNKSSNKVELVKESKNGAVYGIVKEKDGYYVKKGLNEQSLDYIGGMFMKNKNRFSSYAEALKRLELLRGQESVISEATKYVLKKKTEEKPSEPIVGSETPSELPPPSPESEEPAGEVPLPMPDAAPEPVDADEPIKTTEPSNDEGSSESKRSDYMAEVQKFAGKLGQELRDQKEKMESDDIKYVLNMIISAVDLNKLEFEDLEEIGKKFDREEESQSPESEETPSPEGEELPEPEGEETPSPEGEETAPPSPEDGEDFGAMKELEEFINTPISTKEIDLSKYAMKEENDNLVELDLDEIKTQINKSVDEILAKHFK